MTTEAQPLRAPRLEGVAPRRFLVAADFSSRAWSVVPLAEAAARAWNAPLDFVHVDTSSPQLEEGPAPSRVRLRLGHGSEAVEIEVAEGHDVAATLDTMRRRVPGSVIALATHGRINLTEMTWGSVCEDLLIGFSAPVLAVGPRYDSDGQIHRVAACVGPSDVRTNLVADAAAWARRLSCPLTVFAVDRGGQDRTIWPSLLSLTERLSEDGGHDVSVALARSHRPAAAITHFARSVPGTLLVMSPRGRTRAERRFLGSVTRQVMRHASSGVLLLPQSEIVSETPSTTDTPIEQGRPADLHDDYLNWSQESGFVALTEAADETEG